MMYPGRLLTAFSTLIPGVVLLATVLPAAESASPSWPRFHGPRGDNHSPETGLLKKWPKAGPKFLWTVKDLGFGYSSVTVAHNLIYTAGNINYASEDAEESDDRTAITALTLDGKVQWTNNDCDAFVGHMLGTRSTPTIDGERLYYETPLGDVVCLSALTGKNIWGPVNILDDFGAENIQWALSESLLIDGNHVICCPCGPNTAVVALDKMTGKTVWKSEPAMGIPEPKEGEEPKADAQPPQPVGDPASYASPILVEHGGLRIILTMTGRALIGVNAESGKLLFRFPHKTTFDAAVANPVFHDGQVFISTGYGGGSVMVKLAVDGQTVTAKEVWRSDDLDNHHGGVILVDGYLYGSAHRRSNAKWICLDWKTGETKYAEKGVGKGSATYAEGMLYTLSSRHMMGIVKATPDAHVISGEFKIPLPGERITTSRSHPVVCGGRLYIRNNIYLHAFDIKTIH